MSEIEKMKRYIEKTGSIFESRRYDMDLSELAALICSPDKAGCVAFAFNYGRAKGYRAAKAEARRA